MTGQGGGDSTEVWKVAQQASV